MKVLPKKTLNDTSPLKDEALQNMPDMSVTLAVFHNNFAVCVYRTTTESEGKTDTKGSTSSQSARFRRCRAQERWGT